MDIRDKKNDADFQQEKKEELKDTFSLPSPTDLDVCKEALSEWQDKYMRLSADFENFKKRIEKDQALLMQTARIHMLVPLLTIIDNFDRAMVHQAAAEVAQLKSWVDGIAMIHTALREFLKKEGVAEVSYKVFDPLYHEALMQVDAANFVSGDIVEVLEKGYTMNGHVVRPAKVSVAK